MKTIIKLLFKIVWGVIKSLIITALVGIILLVLLLYFYQGGFVL